MSKMFQNARRAGLAQQELYHKRQAEKKPKDRSRSRTRKRRRGR